MDFLNKAFTQLADLFRSMTPGARITAALLLVVVVVSLGYLFSYQTSGPEADLMNGMPVPASHLPAMEAAFDSAGLSSYEIRGTQIRVPRGQKGVYMAALADGNALPPNMLTVFDEALQNASIFMSKEERAQRLQIAKQTWLGLVISNMQGIQSATVAYETDIKHGFRKEKVATAMASVAPTGNETLSQAQVGSIRKLVAGAISGLKPENVTVADLNGVTHHPTDSKDGVSADDNLVVKLKRTHEQEFKSKILDALAYVPGIKVTTNVELDRDRIERTKTIKYEPKTTTLRESSEESSHSVESAGPAGRPGLASQQPNAPAALSRSAGSTESSDDSKRETYGVANTTETQRESVGPMAKRVTVTIGIPSSYFKQIWRERNPAQEGQEPGTPDNNQLDALFAETKTEFQQHVAGLLPLPAEGEDASSLVHVMKFDDIPGEKLPGPGMGQNALVWFGQNWSTLGMVALAMFSLVMLKSMVGSVPAGPQPEGAAKAGPAFDDENDDQTPETIAMKRLKRFSGSGPSLRDELSDLVQEDPDAAANILRSWIGNVG